MTPVAAPTKLDPRMLGTCLHQQMRITLCVVCIPSDWLEERRAQIRSRQHRNPHEAVALLQSIVHSVQQMQQRDCELVNNEACTQRNENEDGDS